MSTLWVHRRELQVARTVQDCRPTCSNHLCHGQKSLYWGWSFHLLIGIRNPYNGYINPYYWVDFPIPYYMEIMGVDRPDRTFLIYADFHRNHVQEMRPNLSWRFKNP